MHKLSKKIKSAALFGFCSIVIYAAFVLIFTIVTVNGYPLIYRVSQGLVFKGEDSYKWFSDFDQEKYYAILVFGSSVAGRGISPKIVENAGHSIYILATDDQTLINTEVLIYTLVKKGKVRLVILDLFETVVDQSPLESTADIIENSESDHVAWSMVV